MSSDEMLVDLTDIHAEEQKTPQYSLFKTEQSDSPRETSEYQRLSSDMEAGLPVTTKKTFGNSFGGKLRDMWRFNSRSEDANAIDQSTDDNTGPQTRVMFSHIQIDDRKGAKHSMSSSPSDQVEKWKAEIRKLNSGNKRLSQDNTILRAQRDKAIQEERDFRFAAQEELKYLESELEAANSRDLTVRKKSKREADLETELLYANEKNITLKKALDECKDKIFAMQPEQQVSDSQISDQYENFCECIGDWVDTQFDDIDACLAETRPHNLSQENAALVNQILPMGTLQLGQVYPNAAAAIVEMMVHGILKGLVLQTNARFPGLHKAYEEFLDVLDDGLSGSDTKKDNRHTGLWSPKCYQALLCNHNFAGVRLEHCKSVSQKIGSIFSKAITKHNDKTFDADKCLKLVMQAEDMAATINCLPTEYRYECPFSPGVIGGTHVMMACDWGEYECVDVQTGRKIRSLDSVQLGENGRIGLKLCTLSPALVRKGNREVKEMVLKKAEVLLKLDYPLGKSRKRKAGAE